MDDEPYVVGGERRIAQLINNARFRIRQIFRNLFHNFYLEELGQHALVNLNFVDHIMQLVEQGRNFDDPELLAVQNQHLMVHHQLPRYDYLALRFFDFFRGEFTAIIDQNNNQNRNNRHHLMILNNILGALERQRYVTEARNGIMIEDINPDIQPLNEQVALLDLRNNFQNDQFTPEQEQDLNQFYNFMFIDPNSVLGHRIYFEQRGGGELGARYREEEEQNAQHNQRRGRGIRRRGRGSRRRGRGNQRRGRGIQRRDRE